MYVVLCRDIRNDVAVIITLSGQIENNNKKR